MAERALKDQIIADMKSAMKSKDNLKLQVLRLVYAEIKNQEIDQKAPVNNLQVVSILKKQIKQYKESIAQYEQVNRSDGLQDQKEKMQVVQSYLPKPLSAQELRAYCG